MIKGRLHCCGFDGPKQFAAFQRCRTNTTSSGKPKWHRAAVRCTDCIPFGFIGLGCSVECRLACEPHKGNRCARGGVCNSLSALTVTLLTEGLP